MMYLLLALSILLGVCKSSIYNRYAKADKPDIHGIFSFNAVSYGIAAAVTLFFGIGSSLSSMTLFCAILYAAAVFSLQALSVAAMTIGPMSLTSLFVLYGMIIPSLAGPIFWKEPFGIAQVFGIIIMIVSIWLLRDKNEARTFAGKKWAVMVSICFLLSGAAGVVEKLHQTSNAKNERIMFLFMACAFMFLLSCAGCAIARGNKAISGKRRIVLGAASGIIISIYSQINLTLAGSLDSLIYYPVANGGALLLTVLISALIFHENLSGRRLIGFLAGLVSIILLSLPV